MRFASRHVMVATRAMNARLIRRGMACVVALVLAVPPVVPAQTRELIELFGLERSRS